MFPRLITLGILALLAIEYVTCNGTPPAHAAPANSTACLSYPNPRRDETVQDTYGSHVVGVQKNGNNFVMLTASGGGEDTPMSPEFNVNRLVAVGDEFNTFNLQRIRREQWHMNGLLDKKQNSIDDIQAAAEFLIAEKYTNSKLLTIYGTADGGLLMGACLNQRPDLFGVVVADDG
ncbi:prolyl oligopeptidase, partial [Sarracenia purpurea var. burkii]